MCEEVIAARNTTDGGIHRKKKSLKNPNITQSTDFAI